MFSLHETTQRKLCRILFVALCGVPTLLLIVYGLRLNLPGHRAAVASELAEQIGAGVFLDDIVYPRPGHTRLFNVKLRDPETGGEIGQMRELDIVETDGRIVVYAAQPRLDARHFALVWRRLEDRVLRAGPSAAQRIELRAADLTITSPKAEAQTLRQVLLVITREETGTVAELKYSVAGIDMPEPAVLRLAQRRSGAEQSSTQLAWHTGGAALPVAPWVAKFPWLAQLGKNCHFRGELTAEETSQGWRGELAGELRRIDLEQLVSDQFPHKLSGESRAIVEQLRFEQGRVVAARGRIEAGPGVLGQSLVASMAEHFSWQIGGERAASVKPDALRRYSQLALHFSLDEQRLKLRGECADSPERTALAVGGERYLTPPENSVSPLAIVRALSPASDHDVPATKATRSLIQVLPLPEEILQAEEKPPRGHVRGP